MKTLIILFTIIMLLTATSLRANPWCGGGGYYRGGSCGWNGGGSYYRGGGYGWNGGGCYRGGGYGCAGGWYGTGIPNGLGWTMFGIASVGALMSGAEAAPPVYAAPQPVYIPPVPVIPEGYIPVPPPGVVSIIPQAAPVYTAPRQPVVYYNS